MDFDIRWCNHCIFADAVTFYLANRLETMWYTNVVHGILRLENANCDKQTQGGRISATFFGTVNAAIPRTAPALTFTEWFRSSLCKCWPIWIDTQAYSCALSELEHCFFVYLLLHVSISKVVS